MIKRSIIRDGMEWLFAILIPLFLVLIIIVFNYTTFRTLFQNTQLNKNGKITNAKIIDTHTIHTHRGKAYHFNYAYEVDNQPYAKEQIVDENTFYRANTLDEISIIYLENKPEISKVKGDYGNDENLILCIILDLMIGISLFVLLKRAKNKNT